MSLDEHHINTIFSYGITLINHNLKDKSCIYQLQLIGSGDGYGASEDGFTSLVYLVRNNKAFNKFIFKYMYSSKNINIISGNQFNQTIIHDKDYDRTSIENFVDILIPHINKIEEAYMKLSSMFNIQVNLSMQVIRLNESQNTCNYLYQIEYDMNNKFIVKYQEYVYIIKTKEFDNIDDIIRELLNRFPWLKKTFYNILTSYYRSIEYQFFYSR